MDTEYQEPLHHNNVLSVLIGLLVGGLAGAVTALLLAPQSGKVTRLQIQEKGIEMRDQTTDMMESTMKEVRSRIEKMTTGGNKKIKELQHQGKELALEQLDRVSAVVKASKSAVKSS